MTSTATLPFVRCPACADAQDVDPTTVAHLCTACGIAWRWGICRACDSVQCCLLRAPSWRCARCGVFNRSWWKTADAEREAELVVRRRRADAASRRGRWLAGVVAVVVLLVLGAWWSVPRTSDADRQAAAADGACRRFAELRRDEASGILDRSGVVRAAAEVAEAASGATPAVSDAGHELQRAAGDVTAVVRFRTAAASMDAACRAAARGE